MDSERLEVIRPPRGWSLPDLRELWDRRELLLFLAWRDIRVRYAQTALGVLWAIVQPLSAMVIFSLVFGRLGRLPSDGVPYPLFVLAALVPWMSFAHALQEASASLVHHQQLLRKVYVPRLALPMAPVLASLADLAAALGVLLAALAWRGALPGLRLLALPAATALLLATALGAGLWLAALHARYRDVRYLLPLLLQLWLFATPVAYAGSLVPADWRLAHALNPMVGVVELFRWVLLGTSAAPLMVVASALAAAGLCASGAVFFRRTERQLTDVL